MKWIVCVFYFIGVNFIIIVVSIEYGVFYFGCICFFIFGLVLQFDFSMVKYVWQNGSVVVYGIYKFKLINLQYIYLVYIVYDKKSKCFSWMYILWYRIIL